MLTQFCSWLRRDLGQTTAEYVAITAVGVGIAIGVAFFTLSSELEDAIEAIEAAITGILP